MCTINEDHIWFLKYNVRQTEIFVILGHFLPFQPLDNLENQNFDIKKNTWRYRFTHLHHKWQSYDVWFLRYGEQQAIFCHSRPIFALLPPYRPRKSKFLKKEKHTWRYYHFTNVYHTWQSYDVWFLKYGVQWTILFVTFNHFLLIYPRLTTRKIKI